MQFPNVDPIPLPAPVWLMKSLGLLTLSLHFVAVFLMIGGLALAFYLNVRGLKPENKAARDAAYAIARRLPVVMTYVINLGVPPLLFAQVLYGRALYTSSVLIAAIWIGVVPLLMVAYWLLYKMSERIAAGKSGLWHGLGSLLLVIGIAQIYSFNMTLMLRPEVWQGMYQHTATGLQAPPKDPTTTPRWLFMLCTGLVFGGLGAMLLAHARNLTADARQLLVRLGGQLAAIATLPQIALAFRVHQTQPADVQHGLMQNPLYMISGVLFFITAAAILVVSGIQAVRGAGNFWLALTGAVAGFLGTCGAVLYRDGIRDLTLLSKGFDVWDRTVVSNWSVIGIFLGLFVVGLVVVGWLVSVVMKATPVEEQVQA